MNEDDSALEPAVLLRGDRCAMPPWKDVVGLSRLVVPTRGEYSVQHLRSLIFVGDLFRCGRNVCGQAALQVDRELGIGVHVRQPVTFGSRLTRDVVAPVEVMEDDLNPVISSAQRVLDCFI